MTQQDVRRVASLLAVVLIIAAPGRSWAQLFTPNNLVVTRSVYAGTTSTVSVGETLPPGCTPGTVTLPNLVPPPATFSVKIPDSPTGCNTSPGAVVNGTYPFVFNNDTADGSFGVTSPIFLDQITSGGVLINTLPIDDTQIDTSFSSKSELAINKSTDGLSLTFMGYVGGPGFTTGPNVLDVSNGNTPGVIDPTNPAVAQYFRAVGEVDAFGNLQVTNSNAYSGDNGRAAIKGGSNYYMAGNDNNGGLKQTTTNPELTQTQVGINLTTSTGVEFLVPGQTPPPTPPNINMIGHLLFPGDKPGKDTNFRGITIFNNTLYVSKGSGGNGVNAVYQVGTPGTLPTGSTSTLFNEPLTILPGFPQSPSAPNAVSTFPFGMFFANANTLYLADEGSGSIGTVDPANPYADALPANNPTAGLQKWIFNGTSWNLAYTLTNGLGLGVPYTVPGYPTGLNNGTAGSGLPWAPAPDGLRNITGRVNTDGTVNIWAVTSTISGSGDQGADPNQLVFITDNLASSTLPVAEQFALLQTAASGDVLRGVSFAPGVVATVPSSSTACNGVYNGTFQGNLTVSPGQNCVFIGGGVNGDVRLAGGNLSLTNAVVTGNVQEMQGDGTFSIGPSVTIDGNLQIKNIPPGTAQNQVCDTQVMGNLQFQNNETAVEIGSSSSTCMGNSIGGNLQVQNNSALAAVFDNVVGNNLQCDNNTSITGGGNTAPKKKGQCSSF